MAENNGVKADPSIDSPISFLADEDFVKEEVEVRSEDDVFVDAKNGDSTLISKEMAEEEKKLLEARVQEEQAELEKLPKDAAYLDDIKYSKLDDLLTQTQLYSEFLLEKMDDITVSANGAEEEREEPSKEKKKGLGRKRKASQYDDVSLLSVYIWMKGKRAVAAMLTRSKEGTTGEDADLTAEERVAKKQAELYPS